MLSSSGSIEDKISELERDLMTVKNDLEKAKDADNSEKEVAAMNLVASIHNELAVLRKQASCNSASVILIIGFLSLMYSFFNLQFKIISSTAIRKNEC
jgi:hypothetical protein